VIAVVLAVQFHEAHLLHYILHIFLQFQYSLLFASFLRAVSGHLAGWIIGLTTRCWISVLVNVLKEFKDVWETSIREADKWVVLHVIAICEN